MIEISNENGLTFDEMVKNYTGQRRDGDTESEIVTKGTNRIVTPTSKEHHVLKYAHVWGHEKAKEGEKAWVPEDNFSISLEFDAKPTINNLYREYFLDRKGISGNYEYRLTNKGLNSLIELENGIRSRAKKGQWKEMQEAERKAKEDAFAEKEKEEPVTIAIESEVISNESIEDTKVETTEIESEVVEVESTEEIPVEVESKVKKSDAGKVVFKAVSEHVLKGECDEYTNELMARGIDVVTIIHDALLTKLNEVKEEERENAKKLIDEMKSEFLELKEQERKAFEEKQQKDNEDFMKMLEEKMAKLGI